MRLSLQGLVLLRGDSFAVSRVVLVGAEVPPEEPCSWWDPSLLAMLMAVLLPRVTLMFALAARVDPIQGLLMFSSGCLQDACRRQAPTSASHS